MSIIKYVLSDSEPDVTPVPVTQVAPGVLWSPRMWGYKERACVPHWRLLVLCRVFCHHSSLCLLVLPLGHHHLHLPSEQVPWEQPGPAHRECGGLLNHCSFAVTALLFHLLFFFFRTLWWQSSSPSCGWSAPLRGPRLFLTWKWPLIQKRFNSSSLPARSQPTSVDLFTGHAGLVSTPQW